MKQHSTRLTVATRGPGLVEITADAARWIAGTGIADGLLTVFCRHTSASLCLAENAAPAARRDLERWLARIAPEDAGYEHDDEGPDDMPAHLRTALTQIQLTIPVADGRLALGTWQGVYLCEHRDSGGPRRIVVTAWGEEG